MAAVAQLSGTVERGPAVRRFRPAQFVGHMLLALALVPVTLVVGLLVALDVGLPLLVYIRSYDGVIATERLRFRTTRLKPVGPPQDRCVRSRLGDVLHRSKLADLPNLYLRLLKI